MQAILYNKQKAMWCDYDLFNKKQREGMYASNFYPLWAGCYDEHDKVRAASAAQLPLRANHGTRAGADDQGRRGDGAAGERVAGTHRCLDLYAAHGAAMGFAKLVRARERSARLCTARLTTRSSWAPIQDFIIKGLERCGTLEAQKMAHDIALRWLVRAHVASCPCCLPDPSWPRS